MKARKTLALLLVVAFLNATVCGFGYCSDSSEAGQKQGSCCSAFQQEKSSNSSDGKAATCCEGCPVSEGKVLQPTYESVFKVPASDVVYLVPESFSAFKASAVLAEHSSHNRKVSDYSGKQVRLHRVNCAYLL